MITPNPTDLKKFREQAEEARKQRKEGKPTTPANSPQGITIEGVKLYTFEETAQLLHMSKRTVQTYYWQGKITGRKIGRRIYILAESITDYIRKGTANPD